ncbi:MAG TPA: MarC family transcriptional regulator [Porticoccaceae bacterium]|nr:MarC family transcriptional regulator [Porticoccaceae bacterium]
MIDYIGVFISFFAVVDPIGSVPVYIAVTQGYERKLKRIIAFRATMFAAAILIFFVVAGSPILTAMSVPLSAFQISGGIVLFLFALTMIFGESKPEEEMRIVQSHNETAIYPLAVPSLASPGAMLAAVLLTDPARFGIWERAQTVLMLLLVLLSAFLLMLAANFIDRLVGKSGASVISRVMGIILASIAMTNTLEGLSVYFNLSII